MKNRAPYGWNDTSEWRHDRFRELPQKFHCWVITLWREEAHYDDRKHAVKNDIDKQPATLMHSRYGPTILKALKRLKIQNMTAM